MSAIRQLVKEVERQRPQKINGALTDEALEELAALRRIAEAARELMDLHYKDEGVSWMAKDDRPFIEYCALFDICFDKLAAALDAKGEG